MKTNPITPAAREAAEKAAYELWNNNWLDKENIQDAADHVILPAFQALLSTRDGEIAEWKTAHAAVVTMLDQAHDSLTFRDAKIAVMERALEKYAKGPWASTSDDRGFSARGGEARKRWSVFEDQGGEIARDALRVANDITPPSPSAGTEEWRMLDPRTDILLSGDQFSWDAKSWFTVNPDRAGERVPETATFRRRTHPAQQG